jgi:membrane protease YdiL (CAAX protease family)
VAVLVRPMRALLKGPPTYRSSSPWPPLLAVVAALCIVLAAAIVAYLVVEAMALAGHRLPLAGGPKVPRSPVTEASAVIIWLLSLQATIVGLVLTLAGWFGGHRWVVLGLARPLPSLGTLCASFALMLLVLLPYNAAVMALARDAVEQDLKPFASLLRSELGWLFALVIGGGAPLAEELLFRGFLLGALSRASLGFFGAALVTTLAWTVLHAGYSGFGLVEVFIAGLFFCWVLWRTGSLWAPIFCHALYNGSNLILLWMIPLAG